MFPQLTDQLFQLVVALAVGVGLDVAYWRWKKNRAQKQRFTGLMDGLAALGEAGGSGLDRLLAPVKTRWGATAARLRVRLLGFAVGVEHEGQMLAEPAAVEPINTDPAPNESPVGAEPSPASVPSEPAVEPPGPPPLMEETLVNVPAESRVSSQPLEGPVQINTLTVPVGTTDGASHVRVTLDIPIGVTVTLSVEARLGRPVAEIHGVTLLPASEPLLSRQPAPAVAPAAAPAAMPAATPVVKPTAPRAKPGILWPSLGTSLRSRLGAGLRWAQGAAQNLAAAVPVRWRTLDMTLFCLGLIVYLITRLVGLDRYPIYFFTDEAVHTVLVADFVRNGFQNSYHEFLPTYFSLGSSFGLNGVSVYAQLLPFLIFGKSVFVTRATSVFITLLGTAAVALTLRDVFKVRYWWAAVLLLVITPTWFLHSRTAFEYAEVAAFYGAFIYCYLRYRSGAPRWLYGAVVMGALVFYTHGLGEVLMLSTAAILFVMDLPYHFKNRDVVGRGLVLALILALPYVRFSMSHGSEFLAQLKQRGSYWTNSSLSLAQKLSTFLSEYASGLNPLFWYFPETRDIERHLMKGYGNILWPTLPFAILGLMQVLGKFRQPANRVLLVTLLTTPLGSALVAGSGVPRLLWFLMPVTVLTTLGLSAVMEWLERRRWPAVGLALSLFTVLAGFSFYLLYDALTNGPLWSKDYTLYGMQYGAKQIFADTIPTYLKRDPQVRLEVSPVWANGTDLFIPFFLSPDQQGRVQLRNIDYYLSDKQTIDPNAVQVMTPEEYARATASPKFREIKVLQTLPYPDGRPGFYFTQLAYVDNVDQVFAAELEARRQLAEGKFTVGNQSVTVRYSQIGNSNLANIFDGNWDSLVRGLEANPFVLEFAFPEPRPVTGIAADFGSLDLTMSVSLYAPGSDTPVKLAQTYRDQPPDPHVEMKFANPPPLVSKMRVEVLNLLAGETANIHIREIKLLP